MTWVEFKTKYKIEIGLVIVKQSGTECAICAIDDKNEGFSYLINNYSSKKIYFAWINECIKRININKYISNKEIGTISKASCDVAIIASIMVNQLNFARYDISNGLKRSRGLILQE